MAGTGGDCKNFYGSELSSLAAWACPAVARLTNEDARGKPTRLTGRSVLNFRPLIRTDKRLHRLGDHQFLVGGNHADHHAAPRGGDYILAGGVERWVELQAQTFQPGADPRPHLRRMLANAAGKDQRIQAVQRRVERAR